MGIKMCSASADSSADATNADSHADTTNTDPSSPADVDIVPNQADVDHVQHLDNAEVEEMAEIFDSVSTTDNEGDGVPNTKMFDRVSAADNEGDGVPDTNSTNTNLRRSGRTTKAPLWLEDYVTTRKQKDIMYPLSNYISYHKLSTQGRKLEAIISAVIEP
ncbi:hypothetical protein A4A49_32533 [Nicotiana attenuata]|uniref:Uncharacterized protein n=1 Tax=Nicotiana attenuata TaxID=49451 RepID=A0A1J6KFQ7_NICAT|nr:hypothetical protein A4A49_32533 [Nicotiana attenuata]